MFGKFSHENYISFHSILEQTLFLFENIKQFLFEGLI